MGSGLLPGGKLNMNKTGWFFSKIRMLWSGVGILFLFLLGAELFSSSLFFVKHHVFKQPVDIRVNADAFGSNHTAANACWKESLNVPYFWQPYVYWKMQPFSGHYFTITGDGLRKTWNPPAASSKPFRIFMFGGSTLWGFAIPDDETIASHLSRILSQEKGLNIQVINFGQPAYQSTQDLLTMLLALQHGEVPDVAVFYDGLNDIGSAILNKAAGVTLFEKARGEEFNLLQHPGLRSLLRAFAATQLQNSSTLRLLVRFHLIHPPQEKVKTGFSLEKLADDLIATYSANLRIDQDLAKQNHFPVLFYWPPYLRTKKHQTAYEKSSIKPSGKNDLYELVHSRIDSSHALHRNPSFHNIGHLLDNHPEPLYIDLTHLGGRGNELIARRMAANILPLIRKRQATAIQPPFQEN